ncbi:hypothetical protein Celaphus_00019205 [Cervus elaphus hippelaphus]|uniref:DH domain-containing protein n=1 Tax=Cervus elaphus hippelaphus TaxID=46360 RepID=A0A212C2X7_CEREH|nr:hypothetical protein Celaphus_00019205 [Cervus elaphus hippelaphus]
MDQLGPPAPAREENEVKYDSNNNEEEEGEQLDLDSGDEAPEADRQAPGSTEAGDAGADAPASDTTAAAAAGGPCASSSHHPGTSQPTCGLNCLGEGCEKGPGAEPPKPGVLSRVNPYSVIDITPLQEDQPPPPDLDAEGEGGGPHVPSGYCVPVPCGYAVPCSLPLLLPAYSSPVLPAPPAEPADPEEAIYDDVPRENSDSEPDEMIYDDVENGDEGGHSSLEYGWSSSEFESYEEQSDSESRSGLSHDLTRLKEHYERKMRELMANTVGAVEIQQLKHKHELKMQKLVRAAREGTKDGLEKTKAAVKRGRSFIRTKSFVSAETLSISLNRSEIYLLCFPRKFLTVVFSKSQQVVRRYILGSIVDSEKNYVDALKRILEKSLGRACWSLPQQYEKPLWEMEPKVLSERKLRTVFFRVKEVRLPPRLPVLMWMAGFQPCSHPPWSLTSGWAWRWWDGGGRADCEVTKVTAPGS